MKNGICPHCGSHDIWMTQEAGKEASYMLIGLISALDRVTYCCLACGLTQNFITQESLDNAEKMVKFRRRSTRV